MNDSFKHSASAAHSPRFWRCIVSALLAMLLAGVPISAQSTSADLSGTITDPSGALLPGSTVVVASAEQTVRSTQISDAKGYFSIANLEPGTYIVTVSHVGFKSQVIHKITLNANSTQSIAVKLQVGNAGETVNVTSESTLVNTSGAVSNVIDHQLIADLPLDGRSIQSLITLSPGVQTVPVDSTGQEPGQFSVNGMRSSTNYFTVDGVSGNFAAAPFGGYGGLQASTAGNIGATDQQGSFAAIAPLDDLEEFQIQTSTFAPEFGRYPGAQISLVTRAGKNVFNGSIFEYFRNDALDSNDWFSDYAAGRKQALRYNDFGGSLGGPILLPKFDGRKNSTYFFFNYEGNRFVLPQPSTQGVVPSTAARASAPNAIAASILNAFSLPNGATISLDQYGNSCPPSTDPTCALSGGQYATYGWSNPSSGNVWNLRLDHNFKDKLTLFARYNRSRSTSTSRANSNFANPSSNTTNTDTVTTGSTQTFSSRLSNQLTLNASSQTVYSSAFQDTFGGSTPFNEALLLPSNCTTCSGIIGLEGLDAFGGPFSEIGFNRPTYSKNRQITGADNLSWEVHGHQLKFGADLRYLSPISNDGAVTVGAYFPSVAAVDANSFDFGLVAYNQGFAIAIKSFSTYVQDSWKVTPRLVLTFGTRWELDPAPNGKNGKYPLTATGYNIATLDFSQLALQPAGTQLYKTSYGNFAPRLGFSYVAFPDAKFSTVVRGGGGIFYDTGQNGFGQISFPYQQSHIIYPPYITSFGGYPTFTLPVPVQYATEPAGSAIPSASNPAAVTVAAPDYKLPRVYEYNLTLQQSLGAQSVFSLAYVGSSGHSLERTTQYIFNQGATFAITPNPAFSQLSLISNGSFSNYNSLQAQLQSHISKVLDMQVAYTWSHSLDNGTSDSSPNSNNPSLDYGPSDFDVANSFSGALTYNIPSYKGPGGLVPKAILSNWSLNSIVGAHTSLPFNIYSQNYVAGALGENFTERADVVPGKPVWIHAAAVNGNVIPGAKYVNPDAFTDPSSTASQGNSARNSLRGFGYTQIDFGVHRQFPVTDKVGVQFRAELFNILNHPNFANPSSASQNAYVGTPAPGTAGTNLGFGEAWNTLGQGLGGGGNTGGFNPLFQVGGPRAIQLALRVDF